MKCGARGAHLFSRSHPIKNFPSTVSCLPPFMPMELSKKEENIASEVEIKTKSNENMNLNSLEMFPSLGTIPQESSKSSTFWSRSTEALTRPSNVITQVFQMPFEHQRKRDPTDKRSLADICAPIAKETNCVIEASRSGQSQAATFVIKGTEGNISNARRKLWSMLAETLTIQMEIPESCLGLIIGPGGKTINFLMAETSAKITVPKKYEGYIIIACDFEGISLAKQRIQEIIHEKVNKLTSHVSFQKILAPFILEVNPSTKLSVMAAHLGEKFDIKVSINAAAGNKEKEVGLNLSGDRELVEKAMNYLNNRISKATSEIKTISTKVPKNLHRVLVGPKGESLREMEDFSSCIIDIPSPTEAVEDVTIYGQENALLKGLQVVLDKVGGLDSQRIDIPEKFVPFVGHASVLPIKDLETKFSVDIDFNGSYLMITGKKAEVVISTMELKNSLKKLSGMKIYQIDVESSLIKHLIGKGGRNLNQISTTFGVEIVVDDEKVLIAAADEKVGNEAKKFVEKQMLEISKMKSIDINIDPKFFAQLIGQKGVNIKPMKEKYPDVHIEFLETSIHIRGPEDQVNAVKGELCAKADAIKHDAVMRAYTVEVPLTKESKSLIVNKEGNILRYISNSAQNSNVKLNLLELSISIQGLKADADKFKITLSEMIKKLADQGSEEIEIDYKYHGNLIGKGGKNVKHFLQKFDVKLTFPENKESNIVTISGPRSNLKNAIEEIKEFVDYQEKHSHKDQISVPHEYVALIVGKGGENINRISEESGAHTTISKDVQDDGTVIVSFEGTLEGIELAKKSIEKILKMKIETIVPEKSSFESFSNYGFSTLQAFIDKCEKDGVTLKVDRRNGEFVLRGDADKVQECKAQLTELLNETYVSQKISVPVKFHGEIIGQKGVNIKRISSQFSVSIKFPGNSKNNAEPEAVIIEGKKDDVEAAIEEVFKYVRETEMIQLPKVIRPVVLEKLADDLAALRVTAEDVRDGLLLKGDSVERVSKAAQLVKDVLSNIDFVTEVIQLPINVHRIIIGKGGSQINQLREEFHCQIEVPLAFKQSEEIKLSGSKEAVEKVKLAIAELISNA